MSGDVAIEIELPDGSVRTYPSGVTIRDVAMSIGKRLGQDAIGGVIGKEREAKVIDVHTHLYKNTFLRIVTVKTPEGLEVLRHSCSHLMASAVQKLFPGTQVTFGPAIENGFYYDFHRESGPFTPDDLATIEEEMRRIASAKDDFVRQEISRDDARKLFKEMGEAFKAEHVDRIPAGEAITLYKHGDWVDLCEGPHIPNTKYLKNFKLTHVAGAYWRGDENNPMLTRIYGTCFWNQKSLDEHLANLEEAKKRDHRRIGKDLDLFSFHPIAPAMPFFHPRGATIYNNLTDFIRRYYRRLGFGEVITPQIIDTDLFRRSGHYANYKDNMFFSLIDEREYSVKPMNCPGHTLIYSSHKRSYRDLPIRLADFGRLHRYERSGVTAGLTRVRSFSQDDAHIFCREDQIGTEIGNQVAMIRDIYSHFGFTGDNLRISFATRPEKSMGREEGLSDDDRKESDAAWEKAESALHSVFEAEGLSYQLNPGDGAFYGPKIDFEVRDAVARWHQLGTIQLDFAMPKRFDLAYTARDGRDARPVMVHRAVLGSLERFMGILIEHTAGDFPVWLAPVQLRIVTINDDLLEYGQYISETFDDAGIRVGLDRRSEKLGFKIRDAELNKVPFVAVVGNKEKEAGTISLRRRRSGLWPGHQKTGDLGQMPLDQALSTVLNAAATPEPSDALCARVVREFRL